MNRYIVFIVLIICRAECRIRWWQRNYEEEDLGLQKPRTPIPYLLRIPHVIWQSAKDTIKDIKTITSQAKHVPKNAVDVAKDLPVINRIQSKLIKDKEV